MEQLIKMISEKTGISTEQSTKALSTVTTFLKEKMPMGIGSQVESFIKGGNGSTDIVAGDLKEKISGIFGK